MSYYIILCILVLLCILAGEIVGLLVHCDNFYGFNWIKRYVYIVPVLRLVLFCTQIKEAFILKSIEPLKMYFCSKNKDILLLRIMVETLPEYNMDIYVQQNFLYAIAEVFLFIKRIFTESDSVFLYNVDC